MDKAYREWTEVVYTCKCGKSMSSGVSSARCPLCDSNYIVTVTGRLVVLNGSFTITNVYHRDEISV